MKKLLIITALILLTLPAYSQVIFNVDDIRYGLKLGIGYTNVSELVEKVDVQGANRGKDYEAKGQFFNWQFGAVAEVPIMEFLDGYTGLVISQAGFEYKSDTFYTIYDQNSKVKYQISLTYIRIPLVAQFYPLYFMNPEYKFLYVGVGPYFAFNVGASRTGMGKEDSDFDGSQIGLLDIGTEIQLGYSHDVGDSGKFKVDLVWDWGLTNINNGFIVEDNVQPGSQNSASTQDFTLNTITFQISYSMPIDGYLNITKGKSEKWWE